MRRAHAHLFQMVEHVGRIGVDTVRPGGLELGPPIPAREETDPIALARWAARRSHDAVADHEAVTGIDVEQACGSQEQVRVGLGSFHKVTRYDDGVRAGAPRRDCGRGGHAGPARSDGERTR